MRIALGMPPANAPTAFQTLANSFAPMMELAGFNIEEYGAIRPSDEFDLALYAWVPGQLFNAKRHIEIFVDGDWPPTRDVERVYPSRAWQNYLWGKYGGPIGHVIHNWIDPKLWPMGKEERNDFILYVGRRVPAKMGVLSTLAERLQTGIIITSDKSQAEVASLMGEARVVICPSQYCEPFGLAAIEAEMCGAYVIASNIGAFPETLSPYAKLVDPFDIDAWIDAIYDTPYILDYRYARRSYQIGHHIPWCIMGEYAKLFTATQQKSEYAKLFFTTEAA